MVLPWYIAVQKRNPTFYRLFFLEHNLERFATDRFQHHQPFFFYFIVLLLGLMPWTVMAMRALLDSIEVSIAEWKVRHNPSRYLGHTRAGDAFPEFLVLWALFPIVFFSFSGSKLPGYILPSIPPLTILTADYLNRIRREGLPKWLLWSHAALCAVMVFVLVLAPQHMKYETLVPSMPWLYRRRGRTRLRGHRLLHRPPLGHLPGMQCDPDPRPCDPRLPSWLPRQRA